MENNRESGISLGAACFDLAGGSYSSNRNDSNDDSEKKGIETLSTGESTKTMFRYKGNRHDK